MATITRKVDGNGNSEIMLIDDDGSTHEMGYALPVDFRADEVPMTHAARTVPELPHDKNSRERERSRDYALAGLAGLAEFIAVRYGIHWLAWISAALLWYAIFNYSRIYIKQWRKSSYWNMARVRCWPNVCCYICHL